MSRTFADTLASDASILMDTWGIDLVFIPKGGDLRTIKGTIRRSGEVSDTDSGLVDRTFIEVECVSSNTTGIDTIQVGDGIRLASDPESKVYSFEGGDDSDHPIDGYLRRFTFVRSRPKEILGNRIQ